MSERLSGRILVVEDSPTQAQYVRLVLEDEGYAVDVAGNGRIALRLVHSTPPDLVLSDVVMPEMDGHEFCQAMKADATTRAIPVVMLTSMQAQRDRSRALENGADDFLSKPVDPDELIARVRSVLRLKSLYDQLLEIDHQGARKVLLAENRMDDALDHVRGALAEAGYDVNPSETGRRVLEHTRADLPDIVILQADLPEMDGYAVCRSLKSADTTRQIPIVMLTPADDPAARARAIEAGADDFLTIPVDDAELLARVRSLLRVKSLYDQLAQHGDQIAQQADELAKTNAELLQLTAELEDRVAERTAELEAKTDELRGMSQQLWQTAKLATMGELAASIAHELNNPLATISLRVESMLYAAAEDDPNRRALEIVDGEVERMAKLVARLLEFSRRAEQEVSTVNIQSEVASTLELVQSYLRNRRVTAETDFGAAALTVHADRQQLRQVLLNLLTNASDAMPDGGVLTIRAHRSEESFDDSSGEWSTEAANGVRMRRCIVIEIVDTGQGIAPENIARVIEPFFTTKPEGRGTGLGLAICRRIVQEHNGKLEILSEVGKGTTIRITLPASDDNGRPNGS